jgi:uncharacterized protein YciU (UPF0263 family)
MTVPQITNAYEHFLEYLASKVSPKDVLAFQAPKDEQERLQLLTEKNKTDELSPTEAIELEELLAFNRFMSLLKTKAYIALKQSE